MKIIYLHQYFKFPNESGGTRSYDLATGFLDLGHKVEVVALTSDNSLKKDGRWSQIKKDGLVLHLIFIPYKNDMNYIKRSSVFIKFLWFSTLKLLTIKGDVVIATSTPLTVGIPALIKKWIHKTPYIFETRDVWPEVVIAIGAIRNKIMQKILFYLERLIYKNASAIVPLSSDMKHSIITRYPEYKSKQVKVLENISEISRFQNGYDKKKSIIKDKIGFHPRFTVLYAGTFGRVNGINYVIKLANKILQIDSSIAFLLVGEGIERKALIEKAIKKKVLNKNLFIIDPVSKIELSQLYFECDIGSSFVLPIEELWSNSANKFFDTLASGKPVLINYKGWQEEVINKKNIGYVLPPKLNDDDVKKFAQYSLNKLLIAEQGVNSLSVAKKYYSKDMAIEKYNNIFNNIFL